LFHFIFIFIVAAVLRRRPLELALEFYPVIMITLTGILSCLSHHHETNSLFDGHPALLRRDDGSFSSTAAKTNAKASAALDIEDAEELEKKILISVFHEKNRYW
jgi:hypothetical protein